MRFVLIILFFTATTQCVTAQNIDSLWISEIDETVGKFAKNILNKAAVVGLYHTGQDTLLSYGRINMFGRKPDGDDIFQLGSTSKTFTGLMFAQATVEKKVELNSTLSEYISIKKREKYNATTLTSLATHTSGLPNNTATLYIPTFISYVALTTGINKLILVPINAPAPLIDVPWKIAFFPPPIPYFSVYGKGAVNFDLSLYKPRKKKIGNWHYSNLGMGLLGRCLSETYELSYEDLLKAKICEPNQLNNTTITLNKSQRKKFATPHNILGFRTLRTKFRKGGIEGAGGIRSSGNDMLKYLKMHIEGLESADSLVFITQQKSHFISELPKQKGLEMGLGWIKYVPPGDEENTIFWHNGQIAGSSSFIGFIPSKKIGIVILANNGKGRKMTLMGFELLRNALSCLDKADTGTN